MTLNNNNYVKTKTEEVFSCEEEEVVANLAIYANKIVEQLAIGARELYSIKSEYKELKELKEKNEKQQAETEAKKVEEGKKIGHMEVAKNLLARFDEFESSEDASKNMIMATLHEFGLCCKYSKGKIVLFDEMTAQKNAACMGIDGAGKYRVLKSGYVMNGEYIRKPEFEKVSE